MEKKLLYGFICVHYSLKEPDPSHFLIGAFN